MLSQRNMGAPLYCDTGQAGPRFGKSGSLVEWNWCHYGMVEADIHLRPLHTSIFGMYIVFGQLVCSLKGIWLRPYAVTPAKLAPDLGFRVICGVKMMPWCHGWGWYPSQTTCIHPYKINTKFKAIVTLFQGLKVAPVYCYTGQVGPRFGIQCNLWSENDERTNQSPTANVWLWWHTIIIILLNTPLLTLILASLVMSLGSTWHS